MFEIHRSFCTYDLSWDQKRNRLICRVLKLLLKQINFHSSVAQNFEFIYNEIPFLSEHNYGKNNCLIQLDEDEHYVIFGLQKDNSVSGDQFAEDFWDTFMCFAHFSPRCIVPYAVKQYNQLFLLVNDGAFSFFLKKEMFDLFHALGNGRIENAEQAMVTTYHQLYGFNPLDEQLKFFSKDEGYCEANIAENCTIGLLDPKSTQHMNCGWLLRGIGIQNYKQRLILLSGLAATFSMARKHAGILFPI
jgi:hypothetical protein